MIIHNFFSDTALSIFNFFEYYIFPNKPYFYNNVISEKNNHFFKSMQFNLGNRIYQIGDYKESGQLEFPTALLTFVNDENAFGRDLSLIGHHQINHVNEIIATHNEDTKVELIVREDQTLLYFTFQINCESQLQANEVIHQIKRFLPTQKYIQMFSFKSFIEIPEYFFSSKYNDPNKHDIKNLFLRYDNTTGNPQYYFLANYNPIIKLNSITADYADNGQRSYVVLLDFEYLIQMPIWMFSTELPDKIDRIDIGYSFDDKPNSVIFGENNQLSSSQYPKEINNNYYEKEQSIIIDYNDESFQNNKIVISKPDFINNNDEIIMEIIKIGEIESNVVQKDNSKNDIYNKDEEILTKNDYVIKPTYNIKDDEIIIFISEKYRPELNKPVIINFLNLVNSDQLLKNQNKKNILNSKKIFIIKEQKCWH